MIKGHVSVCKVYKDGTREVVVDKNNIITAGLGLAFLDMQQSIGSTDIRDYSPAYFQLGTDQIDYEGTEASSSFYQVCAPFTWVDYGEDSGLKICNKYRGFYTSSTDGGITYSELLNTSAGLSDVLLSGVDEDFACIPFENITKYRFDSFETSIYLDSDTANGKSISEIGLFAKNPKGYKQDSPILMAYNKFTAIPKQEDFDLEISWVIGFLGVASEIDNSYSDGGSPDSITNVTSNTKYIIP